MPESFQSRGFRLAHGILLAYRGLSSTSDLPRAVLLQLLRAGTSAGANLEEAKSAYSRRDLAARYGISLREVRECRYWLRLILADSPALEPALADLCDQCDQLAAVLTTTIKKLRLDPPT